MTDNLFNEKFNSVIDAINSYEYENAIHKSSCDFLRTKFSKLKDALLFDKKNKIEMIEWSKWFAPRIVYDGINDKDMLMAIDELNRILEEYYS